MNRRGTLLCLALAVAMLLPAGVATAEPRELSDHRDDPVRRVAGDDRILTAVEIARAVHDQADVAVLATARNYPDALSGSVLAHSLDAPLLLTEPDQVPPSVLEVMADLGVDEIVLLGGTAAISSAVQADLEGRVGADNVSRIRGADRFATSAAVALRAVPEPDTVVLATGEDFPDAVSVSALAASRGWPVLLTAQTSVPEAVGDYLASLPERPDILPVGGPAVIDEAVLDQLRQAGHTVHKRAAGADRYATSRAVADRHRNADTTDVWVATGQAYPDALTAGAAAAATGGVLHLTPSFTTDTPEPADLRGFLENNAACAGGTVQHAIMAGGGQALDGNVVADLRALLNCETFPADGTLLRTLVAELPVAAEVRDGYDRDLFNHWIDADGDCRDTRAEVLVAESRAGVSGGCTISSGEWFSYYDGATWTQASDVDIDHMVPLAEAWDSGARGWDANTRERFANDLGDDRSLVAVTDNVNQSKSDRDPAEWLPTQDVCRYVEEWTAVKIRWSLTVDQTEKNTLAQWASNCPDTYVVVEQAPVGGAPPPEPEPEPDDCHPAYPDFCIPPPPPDLNCDDFSQNNFTVDHTYGDPHRLDGNKDGVACES